MQKHQLQWKADWLAAHHSAQPAIAASFCAECSETQPAAVFVRVDRGKEAVGGGVSGHGSCYCCRSDLELTLASPNLPRKDPTVENCDAFRQGAEAAQQVEGHAGLLWMEP